MGIEELITTEASASESNKDAELKSGTTVSRGHARSKTLQVRLNDEEFEALAALAATRGLPVSTLARDVLLARLAARDTSAQAMIARLRADLEALASTVA
ncbi:hypothetical protein MWU75_11035 [Ornithinimicrobium sp. F0845]|uniref:plasmid mobilization protein n=1 Tax=Ornithinimicrobium sp. F0845 TaxID=2926412 RepID=UPI001FF4D5FB|nr:hypothetical protein [Ornithinimicrobium sp. F0845]MCK0112675.1 hypothetical protein [Ornithinimicrobium sp. F0845]